MKILYRTEATATGGRDGRAASKDGHLQVKLSTPTELGGQGGEATNPEQLFAAGYSACFGSAIAHLARMQKIQTGPVQVTANVAIGPIGQRFGLAVELIVDMPELPAEQALALVHAAHEVCPYSNATRGNIIVDVRLAS